MTRQEFNKLATWENAICPDCGTNSVVNLIRTAIAEAEERAIKKEEILYNKGLKEIHDMHQQDIAQAVREVLARVRLKEKIVQNNYQQNAIGYNQAKKDLDETIEKMLMEKYWNERQRN